MDSLQNSLSSRITTEFKSDTVPKSQATYLRDQGVPFDTTNTAIIRLLSLTE